MKIKKMTANFGALEGDTLELRDGLNVLYAPNESGKSTWCAFLRAMLYGIRTSEKNTARQKPDKVKYQPWNGVRMSGSMDVETPEGPVTIRRWTERANQPMQAFSATVTGTELPAPGLSSDNAGECLTGAPREVFERTAFIRQAGLAVTADPQLDKRINAIVSAGDEEVSYTKANELLKKWLHQRRYGQKGALPELEGRMDALCRTLESHRRKTEEMAALDEQLEQAELRQTEAVQAMELARKTARQERKNELTAVREQYKQAEQELRQAESGLAEAQRGLKATPYGTMGPEEARRRSDIDMANARELERLAKKLPPVKIAFIPLALAALAFLLALVLPWTLECVGAGCVLALLFVVMYLRLVSMQKTKADTMAEREKILKAYGASGPEEIEGLLAAYRTLWKEHERAEFRAEAAREKLASVGERLSAEETRFVEGLDFQTGDSDAARTSQEAELAGRQLAALKQRRASLEGERNMLGDRMVLESELEQMRRRHEALSLQEDALTLAMQELKKADGELQKRFSPRLAKEAAAIFARLTGGRYDEITLARDLTAKARRTGDAVGWELDYLSEGAKDQLYLALRLALCKLTLPEDAPCPIVLDDALVTFDRERMVLALELLKEMASQRQILLFTCHEREYEYFVRDPHVATISLEK